MVKEFYNVVGNYNDPYEFRSRPDAMRVERAFCLSDDKDLKCGQIYILYAVYSASGSITLCLLVCEENNNFK